MLPVIYKVFENVIFDQLSEYFVTNNLFSPQQYGFRKNSSTELTALELLDRLFGQLDKHKIPINFYIDLSKAFDSLRHDILLDKLTHYGITGTANKFMKSYLCNRKQFVQIGDTEPKMRPVTTGVPQGSIVGPFCLISLSRGVCRISQGGGPTLKFLGFWIYMPRSCEHLLGGFGGMTPRKFLKMVHFRAF